MLSTLIYKLKRTALRNLEDECIPVYLDSGPCNRNVNTEVDGPSKSLGSILRVNIQGESTVF